MSRPKVVVGSARARALSFVLAFALAPLLLGALDAGSFRFTRPLDAQPGWARLDLPDDVLAASRPGLPDLRVMGSAGEVPFVLEQTLGALPESLPVRDVESAPDRETTATVDRGAHPALAERATIDVAEGELLKPVILEASDDRAAWREIARGSIFATAHARMTTLRFAPNDRRWLRLRFDDRNGARITPRAVEIAPAGSARDAPARRAISLPLAKLRAEGGTSVYALTLPHPSMAVSSLRLAPSDAAFVRRVTVEERVLFRDEVARRAVGGGVITRAAGAANDAGSLDVAIGEVTSASLEIAIEDGASPPLTLTEAVVTVEPRSLLFFARASDAPLRLAYGAPGVDAPVYDLRAALALGRPASVQVAHLGDAADRGGPAPAIAAPPHGVEIDPAAWRTRAPIVLPSRGNVAYLALDDMGSAEGDLRIVDASSRQVPYLFERTTRHARSDARAEVTQRGGQTVATLRDLAALRAIDRIELTATAPEYFTRAVTVVEATRDARGVTGERTLGSATWERRSGEPALPFAIAIAAPQQAEIEVRIENGENASIALGPIAVERVIRRVDFVFAPGEALSLLRGNPAAAAPRYDLSLVADAVLSAPAEAASLGPAVDLAPKDRAATPKWFWACVIAAGLGVAFALSRTLRSDAKADGEPKGPA